MNSRRTIRSKRIERSREIYKAITADAAACGMTPKQFAKCFIEQALRELRKLELDILFRRSTGNLPTCVHLVIDFKPEVQPVTRGRFQVSHHAGDDFDYGQR